MRKRVEQMVITIAYYTYEAALLKGRSVPHLCSDLPLASLMLYPINYQRTYISIPTYFNLNLKHLIF